MSSSITEVFKVLPDFEGGVRTKDPAEVLKDRFCAMWKGGKGNLSSDEGTQSQIYNFHVT
jgi:hypothetical protein